MQAVAREFNLSETVFLLPPRDPVNMARARIFTPTVELPFAGHPTIGAAVLVATLEAPELIASQEVDLVLEEAVGLVRCTVRHRRGEAAHARFAVPRLAEPWGEPPEVSDLAALLGLAPDDIGWGGHRPTRFSAGVPFTFVPVASIDALGRAGMAGRRASAPASTCSRPTATPRAPCARACSRAAWASPRTPAPARPPPPSPASFSRARACPTGTMTAASCKASRWAGPAASALPSPSRHGRLTSTTIGGEAVIVAEGTLRL